MSLCTLSIASCSFEGSFATSSALCLAALFEGAMIGASFLLAKPGACMLSVVGSPGGRCEELLDEVVDVRVPNEDNETGRTG